MPATLDDDDVLVYKGSHLLRQRLLLATLRGQKIQIEDIRSTQNNPGLTDYEFNLINMLERVTKGTLVSINSTATCLYFQPGILIGGLIYHSCSKDKEIGYFVEVLLALGPFCKVPLNAVVQGVTFHNFGIANTEPTAPLPIMLQLNLVDDGMQIRVLNEND